MLKMTGIELEKISDMDKSLFIEKGLQGGISYIAKDILKQIRNIVQIMIKINHQHLFHTLI